ncbi:hypothetical protein [uncultured Clostridium sp.]|jgi:hypothetical protein|uniref:hypothetical protein n=1 Tax=uncultured Clostridium sp. TaxID=59620 RepID=UPI002625B3F3|nr:hypothetical protein [uncultured Clostridium sp.]
MSELGYGSPKEIPSIFNLGSKKIISYLTGAYVENHKKKSILKDLFNIFNYSTRSFLVAFADDSMVIGELDRGNIADEHVILSYNEIEKFNYYTKSGNLEIITDKNSRYSIKVSKHELHHSMKNINNKLELKYLA